MTAFALAAVQALLLLALAPLGTAVAEALRARLQMRRGAPLLSGYRELMRDLRQPVVIAEDATSLSRFAPWALAGVATTLATGIPVLTTCVGPGFAGDAIAAVALLAAMRALTTWLALDSGGPDTGPAVGRSLALAAIAEPALLLALLALATGAGTTSLAGISAAVASRREAGLTPAHVLAAVAAALAVLAETGHAPFGEPPGVPAIAVSGRHLALVRWAESFRRLALVTLVVDVVLPWGIALTPAPAALGLALLAWLGKLLMIGGALAAVESAAARLRWVRAPELLGTAFLLALLAFASSAFAQ